MSGILEWLDAPRFDLTETVIILTVVVVTTYFLRDCILYIAVNFPYL